MKMWRKKVKRIKGFSPKKRLGQYFLRNEAAIKQIVGFLDLKPDDVVVEVGPGHGELTGEIAKTASRVIAIEKDPELAIGVKRLGFGGLEVVTGDALKLLPQITERFALDARRSYKLVGNIPYYITGQLLRVLGELKSPPVLTVLAVQKEVAERVSAGPPRMNLLAAAVQIWAEVGVVLNLPRKNFFPQPKVDSAIIRLTPKKQRLSEEELERYYKIIRAIFKQPRKTLYNNLRAAVKNKTDIRTLFGKLGILEKIKNLRPQELDLEQIKIIADFLATGF